MKRVGNETYYTILLDGKEVGFILGDPDRGFVTLSDEAPRKKQQSFKSTGSLDKAKKWAEGQLIPNAKPVSRRNKGEK